MNWDLSCFLSLLPMHYVNVCECLSNGVVFGVNRSMHFFQYETCLLVSRDCAQKIFNFYRTSITRILSKVQYVYY